MKKLSGTTLAVIAVSVGLAVLNSISFFVSIFRSPQGTVYLGTIHYWEDYFFYLNHFFQGAAGAWLTVNRYTPEATPATPIYWSNVFAGKFFGIFGIPQVVSYNVTVLILSFAVLASAYLLIRLILSDRKELVIPAFLFTALSTSFQNRVQSSGGGMIFWPFQIWKTPHFAFDRLGGAPHQMLITVLTYLVFFFYYRMKTFPKPGISAGVPVVLCGLLLSLIQPVQAIAAVCAIVIGELSVRFFSNTPGTLPLKTLVPLVAATGAASLYMYRLLSLPPHIQTKVWEASQHSYTTLPFLFLSIGPVILLAGAGFITRIRRIRSAEIAGVFLILLGYVMFMTRIPQALGISNSRLLFPAFYVFWGIFGAYGMGYAADFLKKRIHLPLRSGIALITAVFVILSLPTLLWEINLKLPKATDEADPLVYLPAGVYEGFASLEKTGSYDDTVVANPARHMDSLVPAISGHTVYSGHMLATLDNAGKQGVAGRFFRLELDAGTAKAWLDKERIRYAFFTVYDGDRRAFERQYPFMTGIFENGSTAIYAVGR